MPLKNPQTIFISLQQVLRDILLLSTGSILCAIAINGILIPHDFVTSGITGISLIIHQFTPFANTGVIVLLLNLPLFSLAWLAVGRRFFYFSILGTLFLTFSLLFIHFTFNVEDLMLNSLLAGLILGAGTGLCLRSSGSQGGMDILSIMLLKRFSISLGNTLLVVNGLVVLLVSVYSSIESVLYTTIIIIVSSKVTSLVVTGLSQRKSIPEIRWVCEEDEERVARESTGLLDGKQPRFFNINRNYRKDGSVVHCEWYNSAIYDSRGNLVSILSQVLDITKKKQDEQEKAKLESLLRHAHKMQAVGTMAGGIAHNFNNLLGVIMGCTDLARDEVPTDSLAKQQLDRVIKASFSAKRLVQQILTFSRQKMDRKRNSLNLASSIRETLDLLKSSIASSVELNVHLASDCNRIFADSSEISQILMNLCSNAVWAMKEKGVLTISLEQIDLSNKKAAKTLGLTTGQYLKLSVKDTGEGIAAETKERIFEPFFTTKDVGQGTGMGLATVIGSMESYKGTITVDSVPGKGTAFYLYFPTIDSDQRKNENGSEGVAGEFDQISTGTERIFIIDDDPIYTEMGKDILKTFGYSVTAEIDSEKALGLFRAAPQEFDLVITDQIMPHISGDDLIREMLAIRPDIPIILCTGYSSQIDEEKAKSIGVREYVLKPIVNKDMAKLIRKVLDD